MWAKSSSKIAITSSACMQSAGSRSLVFKVVVCDEVVLFDKALRAARSRAADPAAARTTVLFEGGMVRDFGLLISTGLAV